MITLKVGKRNPEVKAKKLRRDGFVCGVLYGKENEGVYSHSAHRSRKPSALSKPTKKVLR
ncbi:MAG: hypothetical protein ACLR2E_24330 [Lachnospiraceae bacterium]